MDLPFGNWSPDRGETSAPLMIADGVLPVADGYAPFPSLYVPATATALPGAPRGVFSVVVNSGAWEAFGFTATAFYQLAADFSWSSAIASGYNCPTNYDWSALHFGNLLLYTNTVDGLHSYNLETPAAPAYIASASDPAFIFTCANFIVGLNCKDDLGNRDARLIKTSGFNDPTNWVSDGADYQELADGEALLYGADLKQNTALLVQQRALVLMQFGNAGGGAQFSLQKVADGRGAVSARSCVSFDGMVFYLSTDDFWRFDLSRGPVPIGADQIARTFLAAVDQGNFNLVQGAIDPLNKVVMWRYKRSIDSSLTVSEVCIGYEWNLGKWFTITDQTSYLTRLATVAVSYDVATGTYDSQTLSYDDLFWQGSAPLFGALDELYKFGVWTGPSLQATLTTGIINNGTSGKLLWATPVTNSALATLDHGVKDLLSDAIAWEGPASKTEGGRVPFEGRGMNDQFRMIIPYGDTWTYAKGVDYLVRGQEGPK